MGLLWGGDLFLLIMKRKGWRGLGIVLGLKMERWDDGWFEGWFVVERGKGIYKIRGRFKIFNKPGNITSWNSNVTLTINMLYDSLSRHSQSWNKEFKNVRKKGEKEEEWKTTKHKTQFEKVKLSCNWQQIHIHSKTRHFLTFLDEEFFGWFTCVALIVETVFNVRWT